MGLRERERLGNYDPTAQRPMPTPTVSSTELPANVAPNYNPVGDAIRSPVGQTWAELNSAMRGNTQNLSRTGAAGRAGHEKFTTERG